MDKLKLSLVLAFFSLNLLTLFPSGHNKPLLSQEEFLSQVFPTLDFTKYTDKEILMHTLYKQLLSYISLKEVIPNSLPNYKIANFPYFNRDGESIKVSLIFTHVGLRMLLLFIQEPDFNSFLKEKCTNALKKKLNDEEAYQIKIVEFLVENLNRDSLYDMDYFQKYEESCMAVPVWHSNIYFFTVKMFEAIEASFKEYNVDSMSHSSLLYDRLKEVFSLYAAKKKPYHEKMFQDLYHLQCSALYEEAITYNDNMKAEIISDQRALFAKTEERDDLKNITNIRKILSFQK